MLLLAAGLLVWSILMIQEQRYILSGLLFAVLLNMKHLFAYLAPVYFTFLLRHYVLDGDSSSSSERSKGTGSRSSRDYSWEGALRRLALLGGSVLLVCAVSFGPFIAMGQLKQVRFLVHHCAAIIVYYHGKPRPVWLAVGLSLLHLVRFVVPSSGTYETCTHKQQGRM